MKNWVTPKQYAVLAKLSESEVKKDLDEGMIRGIIVNGKWRIYPDELYRTLGVTHPHS